MRLVQRRMNVRSVRPSILAILAGSLGAVLALDAQLFSQRTETLPPAELVNVPRASGGSAAFSLDTLTGRSGRVRVRLLLPDEALQLPRLRHTTVNYRPGRSFSIPAGIEGSDFHFITLRPWSDKRGGYVGRYHVGWWPGEESVAPFNYRHPDGFVEVTRDNARWQVSRHFRLGDFLTRDQPDVWPKYLVLREELLDKLELVLLALEARGVATNHVVVLSGFRTPQYNRSISYEGTAYASRHMYGDAADLIVDADRNGRMDDLNGDGIVDFHDTDVINRAVEAVERSFPDLVGGLGLYHAMGPSGPFAHIDVRGTRARWIGGRVASRSPRAWPEQNGVQPGGRCRAEGEFAVLCRTGQ